MIMAITGYYDGKVVKTPYIFDKGQKVIIIPLNKKINKAKYEAFNKLNGIIHADVSLDEIREERLSRYEDIN